jgi:hypothetical protein
MKLLINKISEGINMKNIVNTFIPKPSADQSEILVGKRKPKFQFAEHESKYLKNEPELR